MGEFSILHWAVVLIILLLFFGPSKLPSLGKSLGEAIRGFKKGINEVEDVKSEVKTVAEQKPEQLKSAEQLKSIKSAKVAEKKDS